MRVPSARCGGVANGSSRSPGRSSDSTSSVGLRRLKKEAWNSLNSSWHSVDRTVESVPASAMGGSGDDGFGVRWHATFAWVGYFGCRLLGIRTSKVVVAVNLRKCQDGHGCTRMHTDRTRK